MGAIAPIIVSDQSVLSIQPCAATGAITRHLAVQVFLFLEVACRIQFYGLN